MAYEVSVITPFHNVDIDVFKRGIESVKAQTIGFEKIEWIIVVHNSDKKYHDAIHEMLDEYSNVRIEPLDNNIHTPSSPRNRGLELATAPYISFLDGDDQFTPQCLKKVLYHIKRTASQIAWFRREYELETPDSIPITEIVLWDQTREEIIVDKDHWDDEKMFSGICGMVTSRIYSREFLKSNGIKFDETVPFAEDYLFNLECYGHAEKICYLPQLIGYHYFINGGSLVQSKGKSGDTLVAYARGYKKVFETGFSYGFYMNAIVLGLCCVLARFLISSDEITLEQRIEIKELLEPFLSVMTPLKVSKIYSEKAVKERFDFPRDVILNPEKYTKNIGWDSLVNIDIRTDDILSPYQMVLRSILMSNQDTDMGKRFGFSDIITLSGYQARVPVSNYDFYEPLIKLQTNIGESGIFTSSKITDYLIMTNSLEMRKLYPCTREHIEPLCKAAIKRLEGHITIPLFVSIPRKEKFNDNAYSNSCMGEVLKGLFEYNRMNANSLSSIFTSPFEILFPNNVKKIYYSRVLFALRERDVDQIYAANAWDVMEMFSFIEKNWKNLCNDIEKGTITQRDDIESELREKLESYCKPDAERANELRAIFEQGFDKPVATKIWNKLTTIIADGEGVYSIYRKNMKRYTGDIELKHSLYTFAGSLIGSDEEGAFKLSTDNTFVEFSPVEKEKSGDADVLLARDVEPGKDYEILITTASGLYRMRTGEIVRINKVEQEIPYFTKGYRKDQTVTIGGINITEKDFADAVLKLIEKTGLDVMDYVYGIERNASTRIRGPVVYLETKDDVDTEKMGELFDEILCDINKDYASARDSGKIEKVKVKGLEIETQLLYRDIVMRRTGYVPEIIKPVRYLDVPVKEKFFKVNVK
ncbi:GH3 family domain-containing protein [Butyrivibrio sp. YAB3001]|uniref:GH3 family domain-containing protein n=1 Tax=Butyrivibrio sp. YAB3001 TaxID=1520812 RepID=UPI0008F664DA|nr:GH3 auxin-responsive promoter family protein [Butyrivibrio sp. YAB3001]SFC86692.1 Glycosyl transferase family 2 [Butyrivibrio sp. YAB3001]